MKLKTGVYLIRNLVNQKVYVGSASRSLEGRRKDHWRLLDLGIHGNQHLQSAWKRYGKASFEFVVLKRVSPEECLTWEQHFIDLHQSFNRRLGYNKSPTAGNSLGVKRTKEFKIKVGNAHRGKRRTAEHCRKIAESKLNMSASYRRKLKIVAKKQWASKEGRKRLEAGIRKAASEGKYRTFAGKNHTQEAKDKISKALTGIKRKPLTEETRKRLSEAAKEQWKRQKQKA